MHGISARSLSPANGLMPATQGNPKFRQAALVINPLGYASGRSGPIAIRNADGSTDRRSPAVSIITESDPAVFSV
jgi:hypothetical protein